MQVGNIPLKPTEEEERIDHVFQEVKELESDVTVLQELGRNWQNTPRWQQWRARAEEHLGRASARTRCAHNVHDVSGGKQQWGGTGTLTHGTLAHYSGGSGVDPSELGRWTWSLFTGRHNMKTRIVSTYIPCANLNGEICVHAQHKQHLQDKDDDRFPRKAFLEDFEQELEKWVAAGNQIIVRGEVNESVTHHSIHGMFTRNSLQNLLFANHDSTDAPNTYFRNKQDKVIDGIWATPGITATQCGYTDPNSSPGGHSTFWADITYESALGHRLPDPTSPEARRLKLCDSKVTDKYLDKYEQLLQENRVCARQFKLEASAIPGRPLTQAQCDEANTIDDLRTKCMKKAEKKCRHLHMGAVQFSLKTEQPRCRIRFWTLALCRRL